ncbi:xanthine/uracil permease family protein-like protein [Eremomyces bilateralis CBS 781.70]|uniref:Xanthine/uracil permease family protein-like protein n=1 Tax=Eremomyces bilateralis CBS 781.70 TaxID=1392243 RepID=A0A6G1FW67_9PEZI|nr:xanthine/uracil permease family protein-like protein [Eremomyces bilateralis CBS 781.70]KAF1809921.1 xanthine/uracil permease family protein-like protein [Eremomyces bilateralis CBS 781.70]
MDSIRRGIESFNGVVGRSTFGRVFRLEGSGHEKELRGARFLTEIRAGVTTFFTMSYIIAVNASILADSGGTCVCTDPLDLTCSNNEPYQQCLIDVHRDFITATAVITCISSFLFGLMTNLPVSLGPGMGMNAYFAYQVVGFHGTGPVPYRLALAAVFIEGFIFVFLSLIGMRQWLVRLLPTSIKVASGCGIGLFLSLIGLSYSAGIGAITGSAVTPLDLAGCQPQYRDDATGECVSHKMQNPTMWIGIFCGGILTTYLMSYKFKSAIIIGILVVSIISWPRSTPMTFFPHTDLGDSKFDFFKQVVTFRPMQHTLNAIDWNIGRAGSQFVLALFTFLYVDIIDCTATLYSMARFSGVVDQTSGDFPRSTIAYCTDAISISIGAVFGCSPVTAFIESGAGIAEGGKTGLTAMTCGICFFISIFFAPIFASIPPWATGCTLIIVGCMMCRQITMINWRYIGDAIPAFVTLVFMPFSYSVAYGLIAGLATYVALNGLIFLTKLLSFGHITPVDEDHQEYWTIKPSGTRPWFIRAVQDPHEYFRNPAGHDDGKGIREVTDMDDAGYPDGRVRGAAYGEMSSERGLTRKQSRQMSSGGSQSSTEDRMAVHVSQLQRTRLPREKEMGGGVYVSEFKH